MPQMDSGNKANLVDLNNALNVYVALLAVSFGWLALIVAAPLLSQAHGVLALILYRSFSAVCHQIPERSFYLHGSPLAVCSRCTGIYLGFVVGLLLYPLLRSLGECRLPDRRWLMLAALPALIDFGGGYFNFFTNTFFSRTATGALFGAAVAFYILPGFVATFRDFSTEIFLWRKLISKSRP